MPCMTMFERDRQWARLYDWLQVTVGEAQDDRFFAENVWGPVWRAADSMLNCELAPVRDCGRASALLATLAGQAGYITHLDTWADR